MDRIVVPELNVTGQFARLRARGRRARGRVGHARRPGLPFTALQIADYITDGVQPVDHSGVWEAGVTGEARVG